MDKQENLLFFVGVQITFGAIVTKTLTEHDPWIPEQ